MEHDASFSVEQESISVDGTCGARSETCLAVFALFHHSWFLPAVVLAGEVRVDGDELVEASEASDVGDVVSSVFCESASNGQQFQRQQCFGCGVSFSFEGFIQDVGNVFRSVIVCYVRGREDQRSLLAFERENCLSLGAGNSGYDYGFGVWQSFGEPEAEETEAQLIKFFVEQSLREASLDFVLQFLKVSC